MKRIELDRETEKDLKALAILTGKAEPDVLRDAVAVYLEDVRDAREADAVLDRIEAGEEQALSMDELERRLGLDG